MRAAEARWLLTLGSLTLVLLGMPSGPAVATEAALDLPVGEFDRVHFTGSATVRLTQGPTTRLTAHGDAELLATVRVETRDGGLYIEADAQPHGLVLDLRVARLTQFVSEGQGRITGADLNVDALQLEGSGGSSFDMLRLEARRLQVRGRGATNFDLTGQVDSQVVDLDGSGAYRAAELISDCAAVNVSGTSDVRVWADEQLDVHVAGAASIRYAGSPRVSKQVSGMARLQRVPGIVI